MDEAYEGGWKELLERLRANVDAFNRASAGARAVVYPEPGVDHDGEFRVTRSLSQEDSGAPTVWVALEFDTGTGQGKWTFGTASPPPPRGSGVQQFSGRFRLGDGQSENLIEELLHKY